VRIALVSPYALDRPGGVQNQVLGLAGALSRMGHATTVLAPGRPAGVRDMGTALAQGLASGAVVLAGPATGVRANGSVAPVSLSPAAAWRVRTILRRGAFDVVHLHEPFAPLLAYAWLLDPTVRTVATLHRSGGDGIYRALGPLGRAVAPRIDVACAVSEAARATAAPLFGTAVPVLFNGVELPGGADRGPGERGASGPVVAAGRGASGPVVVFVSRHEPRKGLVVLLEAWARGDLPGECWVLSAGGQTAELRRRFAGAERVRWLGVVDQEEKAAILASAQVLCAPSLGGESFGVVLLEGMANRCAVVASDIPGYRDAAADHAVLVPPGDAGALHRALGKVLADVVAGHGVAAADALDRAAAHAAGWSMDALARRYLGYYVGTPGPVGGASGT